MGRLDEALAELGQAEELDPLAPVILTQTGTVLRGQGRDRKATGQFGQALELDAKYAPVLRRASVGARRAFPGGGGPE